MRLSVWSLFDPRFALSICLSHLPLHPPELWLLPFLPPCGCCRSKIPCALGLNEESGPLVNNAPLTNWRPGWYWRNWCQKVVLRPISLVHSAYDSAESIATPPDSDFEDEQLNTMRASPLYIRERQENEGQTRLWTRKVDGPVFLETWSFRTVNRVRTRFPNKTEVTNRETDSRVVFIFFFWMCWLGKCRENCSWWKQGSFAYSSKVWNYEAGTSSGISLNSCILELQQRGYAQRLEMEDTPSRIFWLSKRTITLARRTYLWRKMRFEKLRYEIHTSWENLKRARELRVDEFSVQTLRESHETIQRLTSQMQEMQEQMNSMEDSGGISRSGIESQWEIVLRSQSTSSDSKFLFHVEAATNACQLSHGMRPGLQEFFLGVISFPQLIRPEINFKELINLYRIDPNARTFVARDEDPNRDTIPMPSCAKKAVGHKFTIPVDLPQDSMVGQHRQQRSELPYTFHILMLCKYSQFASERETRPQPRRPHYSTTPATATMGWPSVTESSWTLWQISGSQQGHPRYIGARTREGRGWPDKRLTRHDSTRPKRASLESINCICRNKRSHIVILKLYMEAEQRDDRMASAQWHGRYDVDCVDESEPRRPKSPRRPSREEEPITQEKKVTWNETKHNRQANLPQYDQSEQQDRERANLDQSCHHRDNVSALKLTHWRSVCTRSVWFQSEWISTGEMS